MDEIQNQPLAGGSVGDRKNVVFFGDTGDSIAEGTFKTIPDREEYGEDPLHELEVTFREDPITGCPHWNETFHSGTKLNGGLIDPAILWGRNGLFAVLSPYTITLMRIRGREIPEMIILGTGHLKE